MVLCVLLVGCVTVPQVVVDPNLPAFVASQALLAKVKFSSVEDKEVDLCNGCGERGGNHDFFRSLFRASIRSDLPERVTKLLTAGRAVDASASRALEMRAKLKQFNVELGIGIAKIYMLTEYQLLEDKNVMATWLIPSSGASNSMATRDNAEEAMASAINSNAAALYLRFVSDTSPADKERAGKELAAIDARMQAEMKLSANPLFAAVGWTAITLVNGVKSVGKALDSAGASYARYCQDNAGECARS